MTRIQKWATGILSVVAAVGAVLSYASLYAAAVPTFGQWLAAGFPLLVDALILGASLQYIATARVGRPRGGWRLTAHTGVAGTVTLNALAAPSLGAVPWHVTAPIVWSVLVELTSRTVLGEWRAQHRAALDRVPVRLWLTAPLESARVWLRLARRVEGEQATARLEVGAHAAAVEALRLALPGRGGRTARRILRRQLRAGSLPPEAVLAACGWLEPSPTPRTPHAVLRAALGAALSTTADQATSGPPEPPPAAQAPPTVAVLPVAAARTRTPVTTARAKAKRHPRRRRALTYAEALDTARQAVTDGLLPSQPSATALRGLGFGVDRARQLAHDLATEGATP